MKVQLVIIVSVTRNVTRLRYVVTLQVCTHPKVILSDNGMQFQSTLWKRTMQKHDVEVRYSPIRHPQSNTSERCMRNLEVLQDLLSLKSSKVGRTDPS